MQSRVLANASEVQELRFKGEAADGLIDRLTIRADGMRERVEAESRAVAAKLQSLDELTLSMQKEQQINFNIQNIYRGISPDPPKPKEEPKDKKPQKEKTENDSDGDEAEAED